MTNLFFVLLSQVTWKKKTFRFENSMYFALYMDTMPMIRVVVRVSCLCGTRNSGRKARIGLMCFEQKLVFQSAQNTILRMEQKSNFKLHLICEKLTGK